MYNKECNRLTLLVVLYKQSIISSTTIKSFCENCTKYHENVKLIIWDNSPNEIENDNSTSSANSFFKIPKKNMGLRKLSRYLHLLEPNEYVSSNHTYDLVLLTTADSQVEHHSAMN